VTTQVFNVRPIMADSFSVTTCNGFSVIDLIEHILNLNITLCYLLLIKLIALVCLTQ